MVQLQTDARGDHVPEIGVRRWHTSSSARVASIVITNFNYAEYLRESIDSALRQDYPHVEVIVVDDGSTDGSAAIIDSYGDRIRKVFKARGGQCSAFNAGFAISRGDFIIFLDADDVLIDNAVSLHAEHLGRQNRAVKSCGYMDVIDSRGQPTGHRVPQQLPESGNYLDVTLQNGLDSFQTSFTSGHAWARHFLEVVLPLPENDLIGADGYLTAIDRLFGPLEFIHEPVVRYRQHSRNKGPSRFRFSVDYMQNRIDRKKHRINFAEEWIRRMGYIYDRRNFRRLRDWRLILMSHCLGLLHRESGKVGFGELVLAPFRGQPPRSGASAGISLCLLAVRLMPRSVAIDLSRFLLGRTRLGADRSLATGGSGSTTAAGR